MLSDKGGGIT